MKSPEPVSSPEYGVCYRTGNGGMIPVLTGCATPDRARDALLTRFKIQPFPEIRRNFVPVLARRINGKWRDVSTEDDVETLGDEDIAAIRSEEERFREEVAICQK